MKKLFTILFILVSISAFAGIVEIQSDCVYADDLLGVGEPDIVVQCGFQPGDTKVLPSKIVTTAYKRSGLTPPPMPQNFTIQRVGDLVSEEAILREIAAKYNEKYTDKKVVIESIRLPRDIYIAPEAEYTLEFDVEKFGSAHGVLRAEEVRSSFSFTVKVFDTVYVTNERLVPGDALSGMVTLEEVDITNLRGTPVKNLANLTVSRAVSKGRTLTTDMTDAMPECTKGDKVVLIYDDGTIKLEIAAIAEGNAVVGKSFPVRNPTSGKVFSAVYQGGGVAKAN